MMARSVCGIVRHQFGHDGGPVGQRGADAFDAFHDVIVRDDVAALVDDDAGPHAVDLVAGVRGSVGIIFGRKRLAAVDVHHGGPRRRNGLHDGRVPQGRAATMPAVATQARSSQTATRQPTRSPDRLRSNRNGYGISGLVKVGRQSSPGTSGCRDSLARDRLRKTSSLGGLSTSDPTLVP